MIKNIVVEVDARTDTGKNAARRMRRAGSVPGIVYGLGRPPFAVAVPPKRLEEILRLETGRNTIFNLVLPAQPDRSRAVMIKDLQRDPVSERVLHVDFVRVDLEKRVKVEVPIRLLGVPVGVKTELGLLEFVTREVEIECLPGDIPDHIEYDITELHLNQHISVGDLRVGGTVEMLTAPETIVAVIAAPKAELPEPGAEEEAVPGAAAAEPEVLKKGKEAEGGKPATEKGKPGTEK